MISGSYGYEVIADKFIRFPEALPHSKEFLDFLLSNGPKWAPVASYEESNDRFEGLVDFSTSIDNKHYAEYAMRGAQCVFDFLMAFNLDVDSAQRDVYNEVGLDSNIWVTKSTLGSVTVLHSDEHASLDDPIYTVMTYFNDDYEGGELTFPDLEYTVKPSAGDIFIFPAYYLHEASAVLSGEKYLSVFRITAKKIDN